MMEMYVIKTNLVHILKFKIFCELKLSDLYMLIP